MDSLKELIAPKTFHRFSYVILIGWFTIGAIWLPIYGDTENYESRFDFDCSGAKSEDTNFVRGSCFELYERQYNKYSVPIYNFVILNFVLIGIVCAVYSYIVSPMVDDNLSSARNDGDRGGKELFFYYLRQLVARFVFRLLFVGIQTQFLYPVDFPSSFSCYLTPRGNQPRNSTGVIQNSTSILHDCHNQRATRNNYRKKALLGMNLFCLVVIAIEAVVILRRAWRDKSFMKNSKFVKDYLNPFHGQRRLWKFIENTKKKIEKDTHRPPQLRSLFPSTPGEGQPPKHLTLDQIYTNLVVVPNRAEYDFTGNRGEKLEAYARSGEKNTTPRGPEDILNHENKKVLIVGRPGIGKTLYSTKVLRDWALNNIFHESSDAKIHFDAAFFIKFRKFNGENHLSLRELLNSSEHFPSDHMDDEVWNYILKNPQRLLIIFDGIDEFKHKSKIGEENVDPKFNGRVDEKMPLFALYEKLATGKFLGGAAVLTTTRPTALSCIERIPFDKVYEILGFSSKQVKEYVENFAKEDTPPNKETDAGEILWRHIGGNMNILSLCYIPASCFIICSSLLHMLTFYRPRNLRLPTKLTDIYKKAVKIFYLRHNKEFRSENFTRKDFETDDLPPEVRKKFEKLEEIAYKGIEEGKLIFRKSEVRGMEDSELFHRLPDQRTGVFECEEQFCFIHLTMQEFFAAKHLANLSETELKNFVSENIKDGKWQLVFQFLAGLMNDKEKLPSEIITDLLPVETEEQVYLAENMGLRKVTCWPTKDKKHLAVTLFKCCSENSEMKATVQRKLQQINFNFVNFIDCQLTAVDCASLDTVIENQGEKISHLDLTRNNIDPLGCLEICKLLKCRNSQLSWLNLANNQLTDEEAKYLADAISNENCQLRSLYLAHNNITDKGAQHLAEAISNKNCQLHALYLHNNNITDKGAQHLAEAISNENCQLHTLYLSHNNITDKGAQHLAEAISNENCPIHTLYLHNNNITDKGAQHLSEAISNENCQLHTLYLSHNNITDKGAQHLNEAIKYKYSPLSTVNLFGNNITEARRRHAINLPSKSQSDCILDIEHS